MNEQSKKLGTNVKRILAEKGMTQGDICRKIDVDRAYISNIVSGNKNPTLATITKIAGALDVSVDALLK